MLVIKIELWPHGREDFKRDLGVAYISNDLTGDPETGNYVFSLMKSAEYAAKSGVWKRDKLYGFGMCAIKRSHVSRQKGLTGNGGLMFDST